jgi:hypothetical protein
MLVGSLFKVKAVVEEKVDFWKALVLVPEDAFSY